ncbi:hypothetical protein BGZ63DRAFT_194931 [Mariannaea sp. PMI_226]|nr:hypothetical protein BGZ63DRAFT_194931 [Mariannaea sp. PMI_226]
MFVPLPAPEVCDHASQTSISIAQMVARTWSNFDSSLGGHIPDSITFEADGTGNISLSRDTFSQTGKHTETFTHSFVWSLARSGPLGMEGMDADTLFNTFPKLARSSHAWTYTSWQGGSVPAYLHLELRGSDSFENTTLPPLMDPYMLADMAKSIFPTEILDYIFELVSELDYGSVMKVSGACRRAREICQRRYNRRMFTDAAERFARHGMAMWMECGHYDPFNSDKPIEFYGMRAGLFKYPTACGYLDSEGEEEGEKYAKGWINRPFFFSNRLPLLPITSLLQKVVGKNLYDSHPEVEKQWIP